MRKINLYKPDEECLANYLYSCIADDYKHLAVVYLKSFKPFI